MVQYMKEVFVDLKKKGNQYDHIKDFNGRGEYHAVLVKLWKEEVEKDPTFASRIGITTDMSAGREIQEAWF